MSTWAGRYGFAARGGSELQPLGNPGTLCCERFYCYNSACWMSKWDRAAYGPRIRRRITHWRYSTIFGWNDEFVSRRHFGLDRTGSGEHRFRAESLRRCLIQPGSTPDPLAIRRSRFLSEDTFERRRGGGRLNCAREHRVQRNEAQGCERRDARCRRHGSKLRRPFTQVPVSPGAQPANGGRAANCGASRAVGTVCAIQRRARLSGWPGNLASHRMSSATLNGSRPCTSGA